MAEMRQEKRNGFSIQREREVESTGSGRFQGEAGLSREGGVAGRRSEGPVMSQRESEISQVAIAHSCDRGDVMHSVFQEKRAWIFMSKCPMILSLC